MSITTLTVLQSHAPLRLDGRPVTARVAAVVLATGLLALCSWISVPMLPVPMTMQTFGVTIVGALFGWRLGLVAVLAWLAEGASGLPVFSGGGAGLARFAGPTGGYLLSFPIAAALVGWCSERGWMTGRFAVAFAIMTAANLGILVLGAAWLASRSGCSTPPPWASFPSRSVVWPRPALRQRRLKCSGGRSRRCWPASETPAGRGPRQ